MCAFGFGLLAHDDAGAVEEGSVPCCAQRSAAGETGGGDAVEEFGAADSIGAVGYADGGDAMFGEGYGVPPVRSCWLLVCDYGFCGGEARRGEDRPERRETFSDVCEFGENFFDVDSCRHLDHLEGMVGYEKRRRLREGKRIEEGRGRIK